MGKHTPLPWMRSDGAGIGGLVESCQFVNGDVVATIVGIEGDTDNPIHTPDRPTAEANAEFIVRACNAHDDLLAACKGVVSCTDRDGKVFIPANGTTMESLRAAIAKAEGK